MLNDDNKFFMVTKHSAMPYKVQIKAMRFCQYFTY